MPTITAVSPNSLPFTANNPPITNDLCPQAVITEGTIETTDNLAQYIELDPAEGWSMFVDYIINHHYEKDRHTYMMPVAFGGSLSSVTNGPSATFVQLANPTLLWIADWTACKTGNPPEIPDPNLLVTSGWILLDEIIETHSVGFGPDGRTPIYRISGTYVYGQVSPDATTINDVLFGRPPWMQTGTVGFGQPEGKLTQGIINPS